MRAHSSANVMGSTITRYWDELNSTDENYDILSASEWVATNRIDAGTSSLFTGWPEFFGPHTVDGDNFTTVQRYNLSDSNFDVSATDDEDDDFAVYGYDANPPTTLVPPYVALDIIIVSGTNA